MLKLASAPAAFEAPASRASTLTLARESVVALIAFLTVVDLFATQAILPSLAKAYGVSPVAMGTAGRVGGRRTVIIASRGRRCPLPSLDLARHIGYVPVGGTVTVEAEDPAAGPDVTAWCRMRGHEFVGIEGLL